MSLENIEALHIEIVISRLNHKISIVFRITKSFQFLSSPLDSLVKNLGKDDFKYFSQEFDRKVLDLVILSISVKNLIERY